MNIAAVKYLDIADGEGVRTAIFVSGCRRHCKGCHNPQAWDFGYGEPFSPELQSKILQSLTPKYVAGLSVLGGEPYEPENEAELVPFLKLVQKPIWIYTGFLYEQIRDRTLTRLADVIVDGAFILEQKDISLAFRGSANQRIIRRHLREGFSISETDKV